MATERPVCAVEKDQIGAPVALLYVVTVVAVLFVATSISLLRDSSRPTVRYTSGEGTVSVFTEKRVVPVDTSRQVILPASKQKIPEEMAGSGTDERFWDRLWE